MQTCSTPGCPTLVHRGKCPAHLTPPRRQQAKARRDAGDAAMSVYSTRRWRTTRRRYLAANPTCAMCTDPSTVADHVIPRAQLIAQGVDDPDDWAYLQALCKPHHDSKTATHDGGFGRTPTPIHAR